MLIVTDVDGVLNNLMDTVLAEYNKKYNAHYSIKDIVAYNLDERFEPDVTNKMKELFSSSEVWNKVKATSGAHNALQKLINGGHQVYLATDHNPNTYGDKVAWVRRFFPFIETSKIICIKDKWILRADIMIEDNLQTLLAKPYYHRILMDHPWNQQSEYKDYGYDIHRCKNWNEILNTINKIIEMESDVK